MGFGPALLLWFALLPWAAGTAHATHLAEAVDAVTEGGEKAALCQPCHGAAGVSPFPTIPHLAGQQRHYLEAEIKAFAARPGGHVGDSHAAGRSEPTMSQLAVALSDEDAADLAAYYAALPCPRTRETPGGAAPEAVQRCAVCHGTDGRSDKGMVPHLAGQQRRYLENQIRAFRDSILDVSRPDVPGERYHPLMSREALLLDDDDVRALARYFAARPCR